MLEPLLDFQQVAAELGTTTRTLREWVHKGVVPVIRIGHRTAKFQRSKIEAALRKREVKAR
jgi:excisionase family DNA binding protein